MPDGSVVDYVPDVLNPFEGENKKPAESEEEEATKESEEEN